MSRNNVFLTALLVVQLIIAGVVFWPRTATTAGADPLFADLTVDQVTAVAVQGSEGEPLTMDRDGDGWVLPDAGDYPVRAGAVEDLLQAVADVTTDRLVAQTPESYARLGVAEDDYQRRVDLTLDGGAAVTLLVGNSPQAGATHVRSLDDPGVYLARGLFPYDINVDVAGWIDTVYVAVPRDDMVAITLENAQGTFDFVPDADGQWTLQGLDDGEQIDPDDFSVTTLGRLAGLRMVRPLGTERLPEYGLDDPSAVLTVVTRISAAPAEGDDDGATGDADAAAEPVTRTLLVGAETGEGRHVVKWSESEYYVEVAAFNVERWISDGRADLLVDPADAATGRDAESGFPIQELSPLPAPESE